MEKTVTIDGREIKLKTSGALPRIYRRLLRREIFEDVAKLIMTSIALSDPERPDPSKEDQLEANEILENLTFIMAKHAEPSLPETVEEWLSGFEDEASLNDAKVTGTVIALWLHETETTSAERKKKEGSTGE